MEITSIAFQHNQPIPSKYTCDGENSNPPLSFSDVPINAKSLVLIMDDPDATIGTFVHWVLYNIPISISEIPEGGLPTGVTVGKNSAGRTTYVGACPPSGTHRYFFKLYALDAELSLSSGSTKEQVENAMQGHILATTELIGLYSRTK